MSRQLRFWIAAASLVAAIGRVESVCGRWARAAELTRQAAGATGEAESERADLSKPKITISRETTQVTEPVADDGYVDYGAAVNARNRAGVTPENNAAVLVWQAVGPLGISPEYRARFYQDLGMQPLSSDGSYFQKFPHVVSTASTMSKDEFIRRLDAADFSPWSETIYPEIASWLSINESQLQLLTAASLRPRYFSPRRAGSAIGGHEPLTSLIMSELLEIRHVVRALAARSMLRVQKGQVEEARQDLLTCHRLGRLISNDGPLIAALIGIAIDGVACRAEQALAHHAKLTAEQARRFQHDLDTLAPLPDIATAIDEYERWSTLNMIGVAARDGIAAGTALAMDQSDAPPDSPWRALTAAAVDPFVDWDAALKYANSWYDRTVPAMRISDHTQRKTALESLFGELTSIKDNFRADELLGKVGHDEQVTERVSQVFIVLSFPAVGQAVVSRERADVRLAQTRLAMALAAFRQEHDTFPAALAELLPEIGTLPRDEFSGRDFIYRRLDAGYVLYSVGENEQDDNGAKFDTMPKGDDIRVFDSGAQYQNSAASADTKRSTLLARHDDPTYSGSAKFGLMLAALLAGVIMVILTRRWRRRQS